MKSETRAQRKTAPKGRLCITVKASGDERVYPVDFEMWLNAFNEAEEALRTLFGIAPRYSYRTDDGALRPVAAEIEGEKWAARLLSEELYREETKCSDEAPTPAPRRKKAQHSDDGTRIRLPLGRPRTKVDTGEELRTSFILRARQVETLRQIAYLENIPLREIVEEAFGAAIANYEKRHGTVFLPPRKTAEGLFDE